MTQHVLGISAFYHDSAAVLLSDGEIAFAASEERFSRIKGDASFPAQAIAHALNFAGIGIADLAAVGFYDKPFLKFERILETYLGVAPRGFRSFLKAGPLWATEKVFIDGRIRRDLPRALDPNTTEEFEGDVLYAEHHESHAASAFYPSPFEEAAVLTMDGVGEWATSTIGVGRGSEIEILQELRWPDSLGLLYSAFTYYLGFRVNSGEYKVMGLAPYGEPRFVGTILDNVVALRDDGSFTLNQRYFDYLSGLTMTSRAFDELFGAPPRQPESQLTQRDMDIARSIQVVCEEIVMRMARTAHAVTGMRALCLAGGVALNAVANGRLLREGPFDDVWIQPAAGDAGGALGVAQLVWHRLLAASRQLTRARSFESASPRGDHEGLADTKAAVDAMKGTLLGPEYSSDAMRAAIQRAGLGFTELADAERSRTVAELLASGKTIGWFDGRMEFGPRALGARSILADPRNPKMQAQLNLKIKFREGFRPFAPAVLSEHAAAWFDLDRESPYMVLVVPVREERRRTMSREEEALFGIDKLNVVRSELPAVTHVDYSARLQTVDGKWNPGFRALLEAFHELTGCPVLVNTSFNVRGEPIVCTPDDAIRCFQKTDIDHLVLGHLLVRER